jgi:hypothetical protein
LKAKLKRKTKKDKAEEEIKDFYLRRYKEQKGSQVNVTSWLIGWNKASTTVK